LAYFIDLTNLALRLSCFWHPAGLRLQQAAAQTMQKKYQSLYSGL
jgi:hypothetical protein